MYLLAARRKRVGVFLAKKLVNVESVYICLYKQ